MKIAILTILLLLWGCAEKKAPLAGQAVDPNVLFEHSTFPDSALERIVREMLDRPRGPLSAAELGSVETLDASHRGIAELILFLPYDAASTGNIDAYESALADLVTACRC